MRRVTGFLLSTKFFSHFRISDFRFSSWKRQCKMLLCSTPHEWPTFTFIVYTPFMRVSNNYMVRSKETLPWLQSGYHTVQPAGAQFLSSWLFFLFCETNKYDRPRRLFKFDSAASTVLSLCGPAAQNGPITERPAQLSANHNLCYNRPAKSAN